MGTLSHIEGPGGAMGPEWELASLAHRGRSLRAASDPVSLSLFLAAMKSGGTQLKLIMTFQNYGQALFKPMK